MRQIVITRRGGPEVMKLEERPDPKPAPGHVLIRVKASGINFADVGGVYRFDQAAQAHHFMESRGNLGKVVLVPGQG